MRDAIRVIIFAFVLILSSFAFLYVGSNSVAAQEPNMCCLGADGFCSSVNSAGECPGGNTVGQSCLSLEIPGEDCEYGCCCFDAGVATYSGDESARFACDSFRFEPNPLIEDCTAICTNQFVKLTGVVSYINGVPAVGATVKLTKTLSPDEYDAVSTNSQGEYTIYLRRNTQYSVSVKADNNAACDVSDTIQTTDVDLTRNYALNCLPPGSVQNICYDCYEYTFSIPEQQCGIVTVTQINNCPGGTCYPPLYTNGQTVVCAPGGGGCGECTPGSTMACPAGYIGQQICLQSCTWNQDNCVACPSVVEGCDNINECGCSVCANTPLCTTSSQCTNVADLLISEITRISNPRGLEVFWELEQPCELEDVVYYNVSGCEGNAQGTDCSRSGQFGNWAVIQDYMPNNVLSFRDTRFGQHFEGYYCYKVSAQMDNFNNPTLKNKESERKCMLVKPNPCDDWEPEDRICVDNRVVLCNAQGQPVPVSGGDCEEQSKVCIGAPDAYCVATEVCSFCNGPFGFFGYLGSEISIEGTEFPDLFADPFNKPEDCQDIIELEVCYSDDYSLVNSAVGQLKACSTVNSCYDYRTQTSCELNSCGNSNAEECEWAPLNDDGSDNNELGLGVCRPVDLEEQDCSKCDEGSILGSCTEQICELYGTYPAELGGDPSCFYNKNKAKIEGKNYATNTGTCINYNQVSCETYDTKTECIGSNPEQEFDVNINYDFMGRKSGDNAVVAPSNDMYEKGRCVWSDTGNYCFKDSDNSRSNSSNPESQVSFDCKSDEATCLLDMEYPVTETTLEQNGYYSISEVLRPRFSVTDNSFGSANIYTFYKVEFVETPQDGYPQKTEITESDFSAGAGAYRISYFSMDKSMNHEPIKSVLINVLAPLSFDVDYDVTSIYIPSQDKYENNLSAWVKWTPEGQSYLICSGQLKTVPVGGSFAGLGDSTEVWPETEWDYLNLADGDYKFNVTCSDDHYQRLSVIEDITVESDPTIYGPFPKDKLYRAGFVKFGIRTQNPATCSYTINPLNYVPPENPTTPPAGWTEYDWVEYQQTGGVNHSSNISFGSTDVKVIFSYCTFEDGSRFFGNYGDLIYFAIDETAPDLDYYDRNTGAPYNVSGEPADSVKLGFLCNDTHNIYGGFSFNFGCDDLMLCNYTTTVCEPKTPGTIIGNNGGHWEYTFRAPPAGSQSLKALIRVNDSGGNTQDFTINLPTLRNLTFQPPVIIICDPETGINCSNESG